MGSLITLGLSEIQAGAAATNGTMPGSMTKIGKTYKDTCKLSQGEAEVTEHFEEGVSAPVVRNKKKKMPQLKFSIMDPDVTQLIALVGGELTESTKWGFDGSESVVNKAIRIVPSEGLQIDIPNGDIEAVINADMSEKGIFMIDVTVTPMAVTAGKAIVAYPKPGALVVTPLTLEFTAAADSTGKTITATSTGNVTFAGKPDDAEWLTVTRALKVVTVKVSANTNSESRTANVTITADGLTTVVPVTQAGA
jgi:hypothetical protein